MAVYFIRNETTGDIKIGYSYQPVVRLSQISYDKRLTLKLLATMPGSMKTEKIIHKRFSRYRLSGEWFSPRAEIMDFIDEIKTLFPKGHASEIASPRVIERIIAPKQSYKKPEPSPPQRQSNKVMPRILQSPKKLKVVGLHKIYAGLTSTECKEISRHIKEAREKALTLCHARGKRLSVPWDADMTYDWINARSLPHPKYWSVIKLVYSFDFEAHLGKSSGEPDYKVEGDQILFPDILDWANCPPPLRPQLYKEEAVA